MTRVLTVVALSVAGILASASSMAQDGAALYARHCVSCHEQGAVARAPSRDVIGALSADRIVGALETGVMRAQGETLTAAERRAVASFLSTVRPDAAASARSCAASRAAAPGASDWQSW